VPPVAGNNAPTIKTPVGPSSKVVPPLKIGADDPEILKRALSPNNTVLSPEDQQQVKQWNDQGLIVIKG
jgi:hypothetical protein